MRTRQLLLVSFVVATAVGAAAAPAQAWPLGESWADYGSRAECVAAGQAGQAEGQWSQFNCLQKPATAGYWTLFVS